MRRINARLSYEGRVKLTVMLIAAVIAVTALCFIAAPKAYSEAFTEPPGKTNLLRTSNSPDNYSVFECSGSKITARGRYTPDRVRKLYIEKYEDYTGSYSMTASEDGSYSAELSTTPEKGEHKLVVKLSSGALMKYLIYYDDTNGWYFPVNGLEKSNPAVFEHIYDAPSEAAALYLSPSADPDEISTALEQIRLLTDQVTEGIGDGYEKARAISRFISQKVYYDHDAADTDADLDTIALCNVLKRSRTVCAGFANMFCAMAEAAGLDAVNIKGGVTYSREPRVVTYAQLTEGKQNHEWAAFYYEKEQRWVWVDACWDGAGNYTNGEWTDGTPKYMYFDISDEAFSLNHRADKAERRKYFSAKPETLPIGARTDESGEPVAEITSQSTADGEKAVNAESTDDAGDTAETTFHPHPGDGVTVTEHPISSKADDDGSDTVLIVIIAALAAGVVVLTAAVIIIFKKRKE